MLYRDGDTIVAPATPPGTGALAVVRLSGPDSARIADDVFLGAARPSEAPARTALHGRIVDGEGAAIDEVLLLRFIAPHSYTGEDAVEISCHGGPYLVRKIVDRLTRAGARPAAPGEFTRRAFVNGRIDLAQAESVADLIRARTEGAARSALRQLRGELSERLGAIRERLVDLLARVEADLDFADEEEAPVYDRAEARESVAAAAMELGRLAASGEAGRLVRDGVRAAIVGRPNSGKSTLFNALLGEDRAIVSPEPGTTRDPLDGEIEIGGFLFRLSDTAGFRAAKGAIEEEGIRRARLRRDEADLLLVVVDRSAPLEEEDREVLASTEARNRLVVFAKGDLPSAIAESPAPGGAIVVSALAGEGLDALREAMLAAMGAAGPEALGDAVVTSARHLEAIHGAREALVRADSVVDAGELLSEELREAVERIGDITGEGTREEVLDRIFSKFCLGK